MDTVSLFLHLFSFQICNFSVSILKVTVTEYLRSQFKEEKIYFDSVSAVCGHLAPLFLGRGEAEHHGQDPAVEQIVPPHSREKRHVWRLVVAHTVGRENGLPQRPLFSCVLLQHTYAPSYLPYTH